MSSHEANVSMVSAVSALSMVGIVVHSWSVARSVGQSFVCRSGVGGVGRLGGWEKEYTRPARRACCARIGASLFVSCLCLCILQLYSRGIYFTTCTTSICAAYRACACARVMVEPERIQYRVSRSRSKCAGARPERRGARRAIRRAA